jgi:hypothetical protein
MKNHFQKIILFFAILGPLAACKKEDEKQTTLDIPSQYDSSNFKTNIEEFLPYTQSFDALVVELKKGRTSGVKLNAENLRKFLTDHNGVSAYTLMNTYNVDFILNRSNGWIQKAEEASGYDFNPDSTNAFGGVFGGYLFTEKGHEPEQMIEKDLFGSLCVKLALQLLVINEPSLKTLDQALFLIGLTPQFKNSGAAKHGAYADRYMANYIARRDKNDGNGLYSQIKFNFLKLQAALKGGSQFNKEKDEAREAIRVILEKATFATVVNYCHAAIANMTQTELTAAQKAATLHALAECAGFTTGWAGMARKTITGDQALQILTLLQAKPNALGNPLLFLNDRVNQVNNLNQVITLVQSIYQFSNQEIEDFKKNWVNEQSR